MTRLLHLAAGVGAVLDARGPVDLVTLAAAGPGAGYDDALDAVDEFAAAAGAAHAWCPGPADDPDAFGAVLGTGHFDAEGTGVGERLPTAARAATSRVGGLRVVTLDSVVTATGDGRLGRAQLSALAAVLAAPAPDGTVVLVHHAPGALQDAAALGGVIAGTDVRAVLCGPRPKPRPGPAVLGDVPVVAALPGLARVHDVRPA